ncbi:MAG: DUF6314 family protein [Puniceicoccaceae bacterium]
MSALSTFWELLPRISHFRYESLPGPASMTGWKGSASGVIEVTCDPALQWIHFAESCQFELELTGQHFALKNQFRWVWQEHDSIRLEQWRRGHAVPLLDLVERSPAILVEREAHLCGADDYRLQVRLRGDGFDADWSIRGPKKDEHLAYRYRCDR